MSTGRAAFLYECRDQAGIRIADRGRHFVPTYAQIVPPEHGPQYEPTKRRLTWPNGKAGEPGWGRTRSSRARDGRVIAAKGFNTDDAILRAQRLLITVPVGTRVEMAGPLPDDRTRD